MQPAPKNGTRVSLRATRRLRGEVIDLYARVEQAVGAVLVRAANLPEYQQLDLTLPPLMAKKLEHLRKLMSEDGPIKPCTVEVVPLLDKFVEFETLRNFMAHGIAQTELSQSGEPTYVFQMIRAPSNSTLILTQSKSQSETAKLANIALELASKLEAIAEGMNKLPKDRVSKDVR
jgi:hypothetical protein